MRLGLVLATFALWLGGIVTPAAAQIAPGTIDVVTREMETYADLLARAVGKSDKILIYIEVGPTLENDGPTTYDVLYIPPGISALRFYTAHSEALRRAFTPMLFSALARDRAWKGMSLVIDQGHVTVTFFEKDGLSGTSFGAHLTAEAERVFPGLPFEP